MAAQGRNEGFQVRKEFVCEAIHAPSVPSAIPRAKRRGEFDCRVSQVVINEASLGDPVNERSRLALHGL